MTTTDNLIEWLDNLYDDMDWAPKSEAEKREQQDRDAKAIAAIRKKLSALKLLVEALDRRHSFLTVSFREHADSYRLPTNEATRNDESCVIEGLIDQAKRKAE